MKKYLEPIIFTIIGILLAVVILYLKKYQESQAINNFESCAKFYKKIPAIYPPICTHRGITYTDPNAKPVNPPKQTQPSSNNTNITVTSPLPNTQIQSPLTITGQAVGNWYFEASFPIKLYDANNTLIAQTTAQAQGNWMTTNFVPFTATLPFPTPPTATGTLILEKDNPSGEPQNAGSISIPVNF